MISLMTLEKFCSAGIEGPRGKKMIGHRQIMVNGVRDDRLNGATSTREREDVERLTTIAACFDRVFAVPGFSENGGPRPHLMNSSENGVAMVGNISSNRVSPQIC